MFTNYELRKFLVGWLCFTSHRGGDLEAAPPFTVLCKGRETFTSFPPGIEPRPVAWQSITLPLYHTSSSPLFGNIGTGFKYQDSMDSRHHCNTPYL